MKQSYLLALLLAWSFIASAQDTAQKGLIEFPNGERKEGYLIYQPKTYRFLAFYPSDGHHALFYSAEDLASFMIAPIYEVGKKRREVETYRSVRLTVPDTSRKRKNRKYSYFLKLLAEGGSLALLEQEQDGDKVYYLQDFQRGNWLYQLKNTPLVHKRQGTIRDYQRVLHRYARKNDRKGSWRQVKEVAYNDQALSSFIEHLSSPKKDTAVKKREISLYLRLGTGPSSCKVVSERSPLNDLELTAKASPTLSVGTQLRLFPIKHFTQRLEFTYAAGRYQKAAIQRPAQELLYAQLDARIRSGAFNLWLLYTGSITHSRRLEVYGGAGLFLRLHENRPLRAEMQTTTQTYKKYGQINLHPAARGLGLKAGLRLFSNFLVEADYLVEKHGDWGPELDWSPGYRHRTTCLSIGYLLTVN